MSTRHVVIIGNGITGITAARHLRKRGEDRITVISGESDHHFSRTALMYIYMGDLTYADTKPYEDDFWGRNRIELRRAWVDAVDTTARRLTLRDGGVLDYDELVIATGARPNRFGWPGETLDGVQGLYSLQDLENMERFSATTRRAVIVGGGLIGVEVAEMLLSRGIAVTFLVREDRFWGSVLPAEEAGLVAREILGHGVDLRFSTQLREILPDHRGRVRAAVTAAGEEIACEMVFLTAGVQPVTELARAAGLECDRGVLVDPFFRTSVPGVWAGGDCAQHRQPPPGRRPVEQVWYTGRLHGEHIAANLCGDARPYQPGLWFNSAKFFDLEYQTYGTVDARGRAGETAFYWQCPDGRAAIRLVFETASGAVTGVNVFGLRHRHVVWDRWISERTPVQQVLGDLAAANFDPEFYRQHERVIVAAFNACHPDRAAVTSAPKGLFSSTIQKLLRPRAAHPVLHHE